MKKQATTYADFQERALEFHVGDMVIPYYASVERAGRVKAVFPAIGMIDVEFPHGSKRYPVEEITKLHNDRTWVEAPHSDSIPGGAGTVVVDGGPYPSVDYSHESDQEPNVLLERDGESAGKKKQAHQQMRRSVRRVAEAFVKKAIYWTDKDRQYKATQDEIESRRFMCPKGCGVPMRKTVYKRRGGRSDRLFGCPECLFLIKRDDVVGWED